MTVTELMEKLADIQAKGLGDLDVMFVDIHGDQWPVEIALAEPYGDDEPGAVLIGREDG